MSASSARLRNYGVKALVATAVTVASWALAGCNKVSDVTCSSQDSTSTTIQILKDALEKQVYDKVSGNDNGADISKSSIRAAIAQLGFSLDDIRTTRQDPDSTKRFCEGMMKVRIPADVLSNAEDARSTAGLGTVTQLADANDVDRNADTFSAKAAYDVQPTDDGNKIFAETDAKSPLMNVTAEVLASSLLHNVLQTAAAAQQQQQQAEQAQQNAALAEQKAANVNSAKTDDQLATQSILAVWRAIPPETRAQLLPQQRAWGRKKDADCQVEAASASTDPQEMEVARLNCDTRENRERMNFLQQYRGDTTDTTPAEDDSSSE